MARSPPEPVRVPGRGGLTLPPALIPLALVAIGVPAAIRATLGRPKGMLAAWALSAAAVLAAQALGEITGSRTGTLGEAQVLFACCGAGLASVIVAVLEGLRE